MNAKKEIKKCAVCKKQAVYLLSNEWTVYTIEKDGKIKTGDTGTVISVETEKYLCKNHIKSV